MSEMYVWRHYGVLVLVGLVLAMGCAPEGVGPGSGLGEGGGDAAPSPAIDSADSVAPLTQSRSFDCDPGGVPVPTPIAEDRSRPDHFVVLVPRGGCRFDLTYRWPDGSEVVLSSAPSGYLVAAADDGFVCASNVVHDGANIDRISLECAWVHDVSEVELLAPAWELGDVAALWVLDVTRDSATSATATVARDFTFQPSSLGLDYDRPAEDGFYDVVVVAGVPTADSITRLDRRFVEQMRDEFYEPD